LNRIDFHCHCDLYHRGIVRMNIIIVEDHEVLRNLICETIVSNFPSSQVIAFENGEDALAAIEKQYVDIAILDISLPGMNGLKLTKQIRAIYPETKIIIYTNHYLPEYQETAFQNGAVYFLSKDDNSPQNIVQLIS
jgi:DNA-binding NarL/FixJ family response regulator